MTTLGKFRAADKRVTEIEMGLDISGYHTELTEEYETALAEAQKLHMELEESGINPF